MTAENSKLRLKRKQELPPAIAGASSSEAAPAKRTRAKAAGASQEPRRSEETPEFDEVEVVDVKKGRGRSGSTRKKKESASKSTKKEKDKVTEAAMEAVEKTSGSTSEKKGGVAAKDNEGNGDDEDSQECFFVGDPIPEDEAKKLWPQRYQKKNGGKRVLINKNGEDDDIVKAKRHYREANVDGLIYHLNDSVYVKAGEGEADYIGRIIEFFESCDKDLYFTSQWFFRAEDTVIKEHAHSHDARRVFLSEEKNDNNLNCIVSKVQIVQAAPNIDLSAKQDHIPPCDLYYDMSYSIPYTTFANLSSDIERTSSETSSTISSDNTFDVSKDQADSDHDTSISNHGSEFSLLDLYSGCGGMSTGLCLGANLSGVKLQTRWAIDLSPHACASLKLNHPKTEVRNEKAEDFLALLKEWEILCQRFGLNCEHAVPFDAHSSDDEEEPVDLPHVSNGEFEVAKLVGIRYGKFNNLDGLQFKVRWKGYGPSEDTWEPISGLSKCQERIEDFVKHGYKRNILPLPGNVDVICGGPPCQGISGFNRFRNYSAPLEDPKNQQMVVFMDTVDFLKPKYVLMENVVDILKFAGGFLGRYALSRLVGMNFQARLGILAAGCYGLPQFRLRAFLWGARPTEILPQFPLPTHDVVLRGGIPTEFEPNLVAFDENQRPQWEKALLLGDAISDLPPVANDESRDEMGYSRPPKTDFQHFIRLSREELMDVPSMGKKPSLNSKLYDHRPLRLNEDDYLRVCQIPKRKGANFRDLPGVKVGPDNVVVWDPNIERVLLPSGKPLVPDYAMSFIKGKSPKPFGRLWWNETIPTVVTRAEPHNQIVLHPEQDRVLSIRENARLQGFPDYYKLCGPVKERYIQVGNAVAVPVARALGYALGQAIQRKVNGQPIFVLPAKFPQHHGVPALVEDEVIENVE